MSLEDEVLKIGKKLEKMITSETVEHSSSLDLLKSLQEKKLNLNVLQKTRIGMTVNNFRKGSRNDEVISLAKSLIKSWKKLLPAENSQSNNKNGETKKSTSNSPENSQDSEMLESQESVDNSEEKSEEKQETKEPTTPVDITAPSTHDPVRIKCRELLANALKIECNVVSSSSPDDLAAHVEEYIFQEFNNTDSKYKARVRSRIANLKDVRNPKLRENVLCGLVSTERIASMPTEDMACDKMKELRAKYTKESIDDHQMAKTEGTTTDLFKCGKCGKNKCTYSQMQTRSADEPMTTFVFCMECGNRWKFC